MPPVSTLRAASAISVVTLISRVLGLVRDAMTTHLLGASWAMGAFTRAWSVPNLLRRLFGEGALSAALVPAFTRALQRGDGEAKHLLGGVTGALALGLTALTAVVLLACLLVPPHWVDLHGQDGRPLEDSGRLLLDLTLVLFPYVVPICLAAIYAGAQNALGQFAIPAAAPLVLNLLWIGGLLIAGSMAPGEPRTITLIVAWTLFAGGFVQLALGVVPLWRRGFLPRLRLPCRGDPAAKVFQAMTPTLLGLSVSQLTILINQNLAEYLTGPGTSTHVYLANRLLLFPHALTALAAATAAFPALSLLAARGDLAGVRSKLDAIVHGTTLLSVPAAAGMWAVGEDLVSIAFVHGNYTAADARTTALTTAYLVAGLPFLSAAQLYARALYALGEHRTPALASVVLLFVAVGLNLVFVLGLDFGVEGLTLASSLCNVLNAAWLRARLGMLLPRGGTSWPALARIAAAAAGMVAVVLIVRGSLHAEGRLARAVLHLGVPIAAGIVTYGALHVVTGGRELLRLLPRKKRGS